MIKEKLNLTKSEEVDLLARHSEDELNPLAELLTKHGLGLSKWENATAAERHSARISAALLIEEGISFQSSVDHDYLKMRLLIHTLASTAWRPMGGDYSTSPEASWSQWADRVIKGGWTPGKEILDFPVGNSV